MRIKMPQMQFIKTASNIAGIPQVEMKTALEAITSTATQGLVDGQVVTIPGLVQLEVKSTKPRTARNPRTGETINVPAGKRIACKPLTSLKIAAGVKKA